MKFQICLVAVLVCCVAVVEAKPHGKEPKDGPKPSKPPKPDSEPALNAGETRILELLVRALDELESEDERSEELTTESPAGTTQLVTEEGEAVTGATEAYGATTEEGSEDVDETTAEESSEEHEGTTVSHITAEDESSEEHEGTTVSHDTPAEESLEESREMTNAPEESSEEHAGTTSSSVTAAEESSEEETEGTTEAAGDESFDEDDETTGSPEASEEEEHHETTVSLPTAGPEDCDCKKYHLADVMGDERKKLPLADFVKAEFKVACIALAEYNEKSHLVPQTLFAVGVDKRQRGMGKRMEDIKEGIKARLGKPAGFEKLQDFCRSVLETTEEEDMLINELEEIAGRPIKK